MTRVAAARQVGPGGQGPDLVHHEPLHQIDQDPYLALILRHNPQQLTRHSARVTEYCHYATFGGED